MKKLLLASCFILGFSFFASAQYAAAETQESAKAEELKAKKSQEEANTKQAKIEASHSKIVGIKEKEHARAAILNTEANTPRKKVFIKTGIEK